MGDTLNILFICTGNIFRSMSAEYLLRSYLQKKGIKNVGISSAGIIARPEEAHPQTKKYFKEKNLDITKHKQRKLTQNIIEENDVIIAMSKNHQSYIQKNFKTEITLYNQLALGKEQGILDVGEKEGQKTFHNPLPSLEKQNKHIEKTIKHIEDTIPKLWEHIEEHYLLFENIAKHKKTKHKNGLKPIILHETKNTLAFMSIDIPKTQDGHVLVIPKKRYARYENIPTNIQQELAKTISLIGKAITKKHEGYNVLLNNGKSAGQYIYHTHFHIIPRNTGDEITIESWKRRKQLRKKEFEKMNKKIQTEIQNLQKKK